MRIAFTGGGTGGHFYPHIAVAEAIEDLCTKKNLIEPELYYLGPTPFDSRALAEYDIIYLPSTAGKVRRYASIWNVLGVFSTFAGIVRTIFQLFKLYPDLVFSTGGFAAYPTLWAARILAIPVVIYDADATPGRVSLWSARFARWIAVAHPDAAARFPEKVRTKMARVGHPIRKEIRGFAREGGHEFLKLRSDVPTILILGGSQGSRAINEAVLDALPDLLSRYNVIHQAGADNVEEVSGIAKVALHDSPTWERYRPYGLLNTLAIRMSAGIADIVVSRAGSGTIFEIASWAIPSILIPIPPEISHDQTENAYSYARAGAAVVIEQQNLSPHVLSAEIDRLMSDATLRDKMRAAASQFARPEAADKIASIIMETALPHETA